MRDAVPVRRAGRRTRPCLAQIVDGLGPYVAAQRMIGELVDLFDQPILIEALDRLDDPRVQSTPRLREESPVRDLVGQGVLERVLGIRPRARLVEKFGALEALEYPSELVFGQAVHHVD